MVISLPKLHWSFQCTHFIAARKGAGELMTVDKDALHLFQREDAIQRLVLQIVKDERVTMEKAKRLVEERIESGQIKLDLTIRSIQTSNWNFAYENRRRTSKCKTKEGI